MNIAPTLITTRGTLDATVVKNATFCKLKEIIGCRNAEYVYLDDDHALMVDEEGLLTDKPLNVVASQIANHPIVGDCMLVNFKELDEIPYGG